MADVFRADGDSWRVTMDEYDRRRAVETIVFHCVSDSQRPYRVVEVPDEVLGGRGVDALSKEELTDLFAGSHTMDYTHDRAARPLQHGETATPRD
jgi:hypothetical protein